jgi:hypothetical protein
MAFPFDPEDKVKSDYYLIPKDVKALIIVGATFEQIGRWFRRIFKKDKR